MEARRASASGPKSAPERGLTGTLERDLSFFSHEAL
jgi:hypothetical protein